MEESVSITFCSSTEKDAQHPANTKNSPQVGRILIYPFLNTVYEIFVQFGVGKVLSPKNLKIKYTW